MVSRKIKKDPTVEARGAGARVKKKLGQVEIIQEKKDKAVAARSRKTKTISDIKSEPPTKTVVRRKKVKKVTEHNEGLVANMRCLTKDNGENYWIQECPYCNKEIHGLVNHIKSIHRGKSWQGICSVCPFPECSGAKLVDIQNHIRFCHLKVRNFNCDSCAKGFRTKYQLEKHFMTSHIGVKEKVECKQCGLLMNATHLPTHIKRIHEGARHTVPCTEPGCAKTFTLKSDMERHVIAVHLQWRVPCQVCSKPLRLEKIQKHMLLEHAQQYPHKCKECGEGFLKAEQLARHNRTIHVGIFLSCQVPLPSGEAVCGKRYTWESSLASHMASHHIQQDYTIICGECREEVYSCYIGDHSRLRHSKEKNVLLCPLEGCQEKFTVWSKLKMHFAKQHTHFQEMIEWCPDCKKPCFVLQEHKEHMHEAAAWKSESFAPQYGLAVGLICELEGCKYIGLSQQGLHRHRKLVHGLNLKALVKCEICEKQVHNLAQHNSRHHPPVANQRCDLCEKVFLRPGQLRAHKRSVHEQLTKACPICGVKVKNLSWHMSSTHRNKQRLTCDVAGCQTTFVAPSHKRRHMASVHEGVRIRCPLCDKEVSNLSNHTQIVHSGRPLAHICPVCAKPFRTASHLRGHVARVHLGLKEKCPDCGKEISAGALNNHRTFVHRKVRNFPCDQCEQKCVSSQHLDKHIRSVHLGLTVTCEDCGMTLSITSEAGHARRCKGKQVNQCRICRRRFKTPKTLKLHLREHSEDEIKSENEG